MLAASIYIYSAEDTNTCACRDAYVRHIVYSIVILLIHSTVYLHTVNDDTDLRHS